MQYFRNGAPLLLGVMLTTAHAALPGLAPENPAAASGRRALLLLRRALADPAFEVRAEAAQALGFIGNPAARPLLEKALKDKNTYVRIEAASALQKLGAADEAAAVLVSIIERAPAAEGATPEEQMKALARNKLRVMAIERLSDFGGEQAAALFEKTLKDPAGSVRDATAVALAHMGLDEYGQRFFEAVKSPDEAVRAAAVRALSRIGKAEALDPLREAASDSSVAVREEVMRGLSGFSDPGTAEILAKGARDSDARVRARALSALAKLPDPDTAALLRQILKDAKAGEVKLMALAGLARRGDQVQLDVVEAALQQKDDDLRSLAVDVLRAVESDASTRILGRVVDEDPDMRLRAQAAALIVKRLQKKDGARP